MLKIRDLTLEKVEVGTTKVVTIDSKNISTFLTLSQIILERFKNFYIVRRKYPVVLGTRRGRTYHHSKYSPVSRGPCIVYI